MGGATEHTCTKIFQVNIKRVDLSKNTSLKFLPTVPGLRDAMDTSAPISPKRRG